MLLSFIAETYHLATPDLERREIDGIVYEAVERARDKHPDFDRFVPGIEFLSTRMFADHNALPLDVLIEVLYCAVKHGDFSREWRKQFRQQKQESVAA